MKVFHPFRLDAANHCLWRGDGRVALPPKAFDVLRYLVEHPGRLITQDEILQALWPGVFVNPEVIKKYILEIRKVLGDRFDKPVFIETFPKRGYQFVAPVSDDSNAWSSGLPSDSSKNVVGRDLALAKLDRHLNEAVRGKRQVIFVTGEAGIGKTTLVDLFHERVFHRSVRIARGQCVEGFGGKEAYFPMLEALGHLLRDADGSALVQSLAQRAPTWLIQFPSLLKADQREALQREILGATRERMVREICETLESMTAESPLVLVFEDLHWVDPSTLDLISALARRRKPAKLVLIGTYRPVDVILSQSQLKSLKQDLLVHRLCEEVPLERLEEPEIADYLAKEFSTHRFPAGLAALIYSHSGGNALFMVTIVQELVKKGFLARGEDGWTLTTPLKSIDLGVPETLQQMLELQLDQLSSTEQRILESASVAGERFSLWKIGAVVDLEPDRVEDLCDALARRQQFIRRAAQIELAQDIPGAQYEFIHSLYRQAVYRRLSDGTRSRLHHNLGERLKGLCTSADQEQELASEIALHFEGGRDYEDAIPYLILAAENAAVRFAYRDSIAVLQHALKLVPRINPTVGAQLETRVLEFIGDTHYVLGAMAESAKAYERAASLAAQAGLKAAQVNALSCLVRPFGLIDPDRGIAAIEQAEQVSQSLDDPPLLARTQMLAAGIRLLYDSWHKEDAALCAAAHQTIGQLGDSGTPPYHNMIYAHVLALQGNYREAFEVFEAGTPKTHQKGGLIAYFFALSGKTVTLLRLGELGEVLRIVRSGKEMAEKNGNDPWLFNFREAWLRTLALDFEGVRRLCEVVMRPSAEYPTGQPMTIARVAAGYAEIDRGNYGQAIEYFRQVRDPKITPKFFLHWVWRMISQLGLSEAWLQSGKIASARDNSDDFLESALSTSDPYLHALAWEMKTRVAMAEKEWKSAKEYIENALTTLNKFEVPVAAWQVHATAWDLYRHATDNKRAETHRAKAETYILKLANSLAQDEPLRTTFLTAAPVSRIIASPRSQRRVRSGRAGRT
jgi:DNA-binding winged helix-turn-helix (wHTH) protein/tetratricopeptide (TPR) repeat protein